MKPFDERIEQLKARSPSALRLAELSAFAVRIEPHLLRALRRAFIPHSNPSAEVELWHSALVCSRGARAALFEVEALTRLRDALSRHPRRHEIYKKTLECVAGYPPLHRFEVDLNALPVLDPKVEDEAIETRFAPILASLRQGGEAARNVARWLLQASPRWHQRVRDTAGAWAALLASSALLQGRRLISHDPPANLSVDKLAQALPQTLLATRPASVVLTDKHLQFLLVDKMDAGQVYVPVMSPALMVMESVDGSETHLVNAAPGSEVATGGADVVILRSLTGEGWRIERPESRRAQAPNVAQPQSPTPGYEFSSQVEQSTIPGQGQGQGQGEGVRSEIQDLATVAPRLETAEQQRQAVDAAVELAATKGPERLRAALARRGEDYPGGVNVYASRGPTMISVSERGLQDFEADKTLKSYANSNHVFADLFGGVRLRRPNLFFLSEGNPPGAHLSTIEDLVSLISLGRPYSLLEVTLAIDSALAQQNVHLVRPWFLRELARECKADGTPMPEMHGLIALPRRVAEFLINQELRGSHTLVIYGDKLRRYLDLDAIAQTLGFSSESYALLRSGWEGTFQLAGDGRTDSQIAAPGDLATRIREAKIDALFGMVEVNSDMWTQLPKGSFSPIANAVLFVSAQDSGEIAEFSVFAEFRRVWLDADLVSGVEQ